MVVEYKDFKDKILTNLLYDRTDFPASNITKHIGLSLSPCNWYVINNYIRCVIIPKD